MFCSEGGSCIYSEPSINLTDKARKLLSILKTQLDCYLPQEVFLIPRQNKPLPILTILLL